MRIMILAEAGSVHTQRWVRALAAKGIHVLLFSLRPASDFPAHSRVQLVSPGISLNPDSRNMTKLLYMRALPSLKKVLRSFQPDVLHAYYATSYGLLGALSGFHPLVVSLWGSDVFSFAGRSALKAGLLRLVFKRAAYLQSTSQVMAEQAGRFTSKNIRVVPFGVDTEVFRPMDESAHEGLVIGTLRWLKPVYGIDVLIRAFARLKALLPEHRLNLVIGGDGPAEAEYRSLVAQLGLQEVVRFLGRVPSDKLVPTLSSFDIFVALSHSESFGVAVLEAQACGVPVVASRVGGLPEVVQEGETGLLVAPDDPEAAAKALKVLVLDESRRRRMAQKARAFVATHYRWSDNVDAQLAIYSELLSC